MIQNKESSNKEIINDLIKVLNGMSREQLCLITKLVSFMLFYGKQMSKEADALLSDDKKYKSYSKDIACTLEALREIEPIKLLYIINKLLESKIYDYIFSNLKKE